MDGIRNVDVIYMTRIQKERFTNLDDYNRVKEKFILTPKLLNQASNEIFDSIIYNFKNK